MPSTLLNWKPLLLGLAFCGLASAQGIYTCTDSKGRKITSDRPIAECVDREQRELNPSGSTRRVVGPNMTAQERAAADEKQRAEAEEKSRIAEEKRRDRAMLSRYPSRAAHDKERAASLSQVDEVIRAAGKRVQELGDDRKKMDLELEFYKKDPAKAPLGLTRRVEDIDRAIAVQKRFIGDQNDEKKRVAMRFDEELVRLKQLWAQALPGSAASSSAKAAKATP